MSSPIVIPFNFQPVATSVKTANYTIPVGRYARVIPSFPTIASTTVANANLTIPVVSFGINNQVISRGEAIGRITALTAARTITLPSSGYFSILTINNTGSTVSTNITNIDGLATIQALNTQAAATFAPWAQRPFVRGGTITIGPTQGNPNILVMFEPTLLQTMGGAGFWLRSGDIINLSNASAFVEEYNQIS